MNAIGRKQLRVFPKGVQDVVLDAVNHHGVDYRVLGNNNGIRLYPPTGTDVYPFKVNIKVSEENTLRKLVPWLEQVVPTWGQEETGQAEEKKIFLCGYGCGASFATAEEINDHYDSEHNDKPEESVVEKEEEVPVDPEGPWKPSKHGFETNGTVYRCKECGFLKANFRGARLHQAKHTGEASEWASSATRHKTKSAPEEVFEIQDAPEEEVFDIEDFFEAEERRRAALEIVVMSLGYTLEDSEELEETRTLLAAVQEERSRLAAEVESLTRDVDKWKRRADTLEARLSLVQEALGA